MELLLLKHWMNSKVNNVVDGTRASEVATKPSASAALSVPDDDSHLQTLFDVGHSGSEQVAAWCHLRGMIPDLGVVVAHVRWPCSHSGDGSVAGGLAARQARQVKVVCAGESQDGGCSRRHSCKSPAAPSR